MGSRPAPCSGFITTFSGWHWAARPSSPDRSCCQGTGMVAVATRGKGQRRIAQALYAIGSFPPTCELYKYVDEGRVGGAIVAGIVSIFGPVAASLMTWHNVMIRMWQVFYRNICFYWYALLSVHATRKCCQYTWDINVGWAYFLWERCTFQVLRQYDITGGSGMHVFIRFCNVSTGFAHFRWSPILRNRRNLQWVTLSSSSKFCRRNLLSRDGNGCSHSSRERAPANFVSFVHRWVFPVDVRILQACWRRQSWWISCYQQCLHPWTPGCQF